MKVLFSLIIAMLVIWMFPGDLYAQAAYVYENGVFYAQPTEPVVVVVKEPCYRGPLWGFGGPSRVYPQYYYHSWSVGAEGGFGISGRRSRYHYGGYGHQSSRPYRGSSFRYVRPHCDY